MSCDVLKMVDSDLSANVPSIHPDIFVLTTLEVTISDHCSRLMDASLALLSTVRAMEIQLARQKQTPPLQGCSLFHLSASFSQDRVT